MITGTENKKGGNDTSWIFLPWLTSQSQPSNEKKNIAIYQRYQDSILSGKGATVCIYWKSNGLVLVIEMTTHTISPNLTGPNPRKPPYSLEENHFTSKSMPFTTRSH